jgi:phage-related minor tail protein
MVTVTITLEYVERGRQVATDITASAKTYQEAYNKAKQSADEFGDMIHVTNMFVKSITYT